MQPVEYAFLPSRVYFAWRRASGHFPASHVPFVVPHYLIPGEHTHQRPGRSYTLSTDSTP
jgi:hypothetical protein